MLFMSHHVDLQHKEKSCSCFGFFYFFFTKNEEINANNMFYLMLDLRFKFLFLFFHLLVVSKIRQLLKNMTKCFFLMLLKCCYHLHPLVEFERGVVDQRVEEDRSLDIFEMTTNTNVPIMKLVNKELLIFKWMLKTSNVHYNGGKNMKVCFL